jgi:MFS family permease
MKEIMANFNQSNSLSSQLLPVGWYRAPLEFYERNKLAATVFIIVNFLFGTIGIWLPLINAALGPNSICSEWQNQLKNGNLYVYAITFLTAISGATFVAVTNDKIEHRRNHKVSLVGVAVIAIFLCAVFLQIQLLNETLHSELSLIIVWFNYFIQIALSVLAIAVAIYIFSIVSNEEDGSPKEDIDASANALLKMQSSNNGNLTPQDFQS